MHEKNTTKKILPGKRGCHEIKFSEQKQRQNSENFQVLPFPPISQTLEGTNWNSRSDEVMDEVIFHKLWI